MIYNLPAIEDRRSNRVFLFGKIMGKVPTPIHKTEREQKAGKQQVNEYSTQIFYDK